MEIKLKKYFWATYIIIVIAFGAFCFNVIAGPTVTGGGGGGGSALSEEQVEDFVGGMLGGTETGIGVSYNDGDNDIDFVVSTILQKYHAIDPADDVELLLACATEAAIRTFLDLEAGTDFYSKTAEDTWRASTTQTEMGYVHGLTADAQDQFDLKLTIANPTFTGTLTVGSAGISETELETIDGFTGSTTQLNYLNAATGTTGTTNTNLVFSTSPTFITPILGAATATSLTLDAAANPGWIDRDSDGAGTDKTCADRGAGFSTTTDGGEIGDFHLGAIGAGTAGTSYTHIFWDGSDSHLYMGVLAHYTGANPSVAPLDVGTYESLVWDFDHDTDTVKVTSPVSGTTTLLFGLTAGSLNAPVAVTGNTELSNDQVLGRYILVSAACTVTLPAIASCGVGSMIAVMVRDAGEQVIIDSHADDTIYLRDGTSVGDGDSIDIPAGAKHFVVLHALDAVGWYIWGESDTCTDGGAS